MNAKIDPALILPLHALLEERTVSKAALRLGRSQPAMSHVLARLREVVGDPLLIAHGRSVVMTPRALALVEPVRRLVADLDALLGPGGVHFDAATATRGFRLMSTELLQALILPALLQRVLASAPAVHVDAVPLSGEDVPGLLEAGDIDLAITNLDGLALPRTLRSRVVLTDRYRCVVRKGHPAAAGLTRARFTLLEHVAVSPRGRPGGPIDRLLADRHQARRVVMTTSSFGAALAVVARTDLAAIVPAQAIAENDDALLVFDPPVTLPPIRLAALWPLRFDRDAGHRWFREQVARACRLLEPR